jgi:hypothetical protein
MYVTGAREAIVLSVERGGWYARPSLHHGRTRMDEQRTYPVRFSSSLAVGRSNCVPHTFFATYPDWVFSLSLGCVANLAGEERPDSRSISARQLHNLSLSYSYPCARCVCTRSLWPVALGVEGHGTTMTRSNFFCSPDHIS